MKTPAQLIQEAKNCGYDFIAITDHQSLNAFNDPAVTGETQLLIVRAYEWSSPKGHANVFGAQSVVSNSSTPADMIAQHHSEGALVSVNHPNSSQDFGLDIFCKGCVWDWGTWPNADGMEVWNWDWTFSSSNLAVDWYDRLTSQGKKITMVSGDDYHGYPIVQSLCDTGVLVYADSKTQAGILDGMKKGHVTLVKEKDVSRAYISADTNNDGTYETMMGDQINATFGQKIKFKVDVTGTSKYDDLEVNDKTGKIVDKDISGSTYTYYFDAIAKENDFFRVKIEQPWWKLYRPNALTNPIYVNVDMQAASASTASSQNIVLGTGISGSYANTQANDGTYMKIDQVCVGTLCTSGYDMDARFTSNTAIETSKISTMTFTTDAWVNHDTLGSDFEHIKVYNYQTSSWDQIGDVQWDGSDQGNYSFTICSTNAQCTKYISSGNIQVQFYFDSGWPADTDSLYIDYQAVTVGYTPDPPPDTTSPAVGTANPYDADTPIGVRATVSDIGGTGVDTSSCEYTTDPSESPISWAPALFENGYCYIKNLNIVDPTTINFRISDLSDNIGTGSPINIKIPTSVHVDQLSVPVMFSQPIPQAPIVSAGGGVRITAVNVSGSWQQWDLNLSADQVSIVPAAGASVAGVQLVEVNGGIALLISDPSVEVAIESGNLIYKVSIGTVSLNTTKVVLSIAGKEITSVDMPSAGFILSDGAKMNGSIAIKMPSIGGSTGGSGSFIGSDLVLSWPTLDEVSSYHVFTSTDRFNWNLGSWTNITSNTFTDAGAALDPSTYYYIVRPVYDGIESASSQIFAKVKKAFSYNPSKTNVNWLSIPYNSTFKKASNIVSALEPSGTNTKISGIAKWDAKTQTSMGYGYVAGPGWIGTDFDINPGDGVYISLSGNSQSFDWDILGADNEPVKTFSYNPSKTNVNWVSIPYTGIYKKASDIVAAIEPSGTNTKISGIAKWDAKTQTSIGYGYVAGPGWIGTDFDIKPGDGVYISLSGNSPSFDWAVNLIKV
jgi:hypothetical protein